MKWHADYIEQLPAKIIKGERYVHLDTVVSFLRRKCGSCKYYEERFHDRPNGKQKKYGMCVNAVNIYQNGERHAAATDSACKRWEE